MRPRIFRRQLDALQRLVTSRLDSLWQAPAPKTLHELRVGLRRLRSLLRPLAARKAFAPLYRCTGQVLKATSPLRDLEVLADELARHRHPRAAALRREQLQQALQKLLAAPALGQLQRLCQPRPPEAPAIALPDRDALEKRWRKIMERSRKRVLRHLAAPQVDLHALRLDVKRLRYQMESQDWPEVCRELQQLVAAQALLGDWHDREVWLVRAEAEADLRRCRRRWQHEREALAQQLPSVLGRLQRRLDDKKWARA